MRWPDQRIVESLRFVSDPRYYPTRCSVLKPSSSRATRNHTARLDGMDAFEDEHAQALRKLAEDWVSHLNYW